MGRVHGALEKRNSAIDTVTTCPRELQRYMDRLDRDNVRYYLRVNVAGEFVLAFCDSYWGVNEYDCATDRPIPETKFTKEVKQ